MKTISISLVFAGLLVGAASIGAVGCKKGGGGDCAKALDHSMELAKDDMKKMGLDDKALAKMLDIGVQHCKDDKWSDDAIKCMADAKAEADSQACYDKLSAEQQKAMNKAAREAMSPPAGAPAAPSTPPPAAPVAPAPPAPPAAGSATP